MVNWQVNLNVLGSKRLVNSAGSLLCIWGVIWVCSVYEIWVWCDSFMRCALERADKREVEQLNNLWVPVIHHSSRLLLLSDDNTHLVPISRQPKAMYKNWVRITVPYCNIVIIIINPLIITNSRNVCIDDTCISDSFFELKMILQNTSRRVGVSVPLITSPRNILLTQEWWVLEERVNLANHSRHGLLLCFSWGITWICLFNLTLQFYIM